MVDDVPGSSALETAAGPLIPQRPEDLTADWLTTAAASPADFNLDGNVDVIDLLLFNETWLN